LTEKEDSAIIKLKCIWILPTLVQA